MYCFGFGNAQKQQNDSRRLKKIIMCDTIFIPKEKTQNGKNILAKNSDREPNEAQQIQKIIGQERIQKEVFCTFINIPFEGKPFDIIVSKPFQMWGIEMGVNEFGLAIGNEAVFTKIKHLKLNNGLTGMDMNRLVLETCKSAKEGIEKLIFLLEKYGQDACGGYKDKSFFYDNSFLIADTVDAYVFETAGRFWAYQKVNGLRAISNRLSIGENFDGLAGGAQDFAIKKGWIKKIDRFSFEKAFTAPFMSKMAMGKERKSLCETKNISTPNLSVQHVFEILRSHQAIENFNPSVGKMNNVCLHASSVLTPSQTTGSMVVELDGDMKQPVWLTGSAAPCLSIFKPFFFNSNTLEEINFINPSAFADDSYWWKWEKWHRKALTKYNMLIDEFSKERDGIENQFINEIEKLTLVDKNDFENNCIKESMVLLKKWEGNLNNINNKRTNLFYYLFWKILNKKAKIN